MGYIGNQQTEGFSKIPPKQDLTGATGASLILSHAVSSPESIDLFINNVRQEPTESYTTDGNTVNLVGYTVAATDDIYVVYNALAQQTSTHPSNQALQATNGTFTGGLNVGTIKDATGTNTAMTIDSAGIVTPSNPVLFHIYMNSNTALPDGAGVVLPLQAAEYATHSFHDTTNNRITVPSGHSGYLFLSWNVRIDAIDGDNNAAYLRKNGTIIVEHNKYYTSAAAESISFTGSRVVSYTAGDYFDLYCFQDSSAARNAINGTVNTFISGFKIG